MSSHRFNFGAVRPSSNVDLFMYCDPNDTRLMVHSDVELCWSDSIHFHDVQWSEMFKMPCGLLDLFTWVDSN